MNCLNQLTQGLAQELHAQFDSKNVSLNRSTVWRTWNTKIHTYSLVNVYSAQLFQSRDRSCSRRQSVKRK